MVHGLRGRSGRQAMKGLTMQKQEKPETTKASTGIPARVWVVLMLLCVLNVVAHLAAMPGLPERIPMYWGADGGVNGWGPRWMASVLGALPLTFLALFYVVPRIDPKGAAYAKFGGFYQGFVISFTVFMCAISWLGELTVWNLLLARARSTSSCPGRSSRSSSAWVIIYLVCGKTTRSASKRHGRSTTPTTGAAPTVSAEPVSWWWALA